MNGKYSGFLRNNLSIMGVYYGLENRKLFLFSANFFACYGRAMVFKPEQTGHVFCNFFKYFIKVYG